MFVAAILDLWPPDWIPGKFGDGTPSEIDLYMFTDICAKFGTFVIRVPILAKIGLKSPH